jgi:hypothetical protein
MIKKSTYLAMVICLLNVSVLFAQSDTIKPLSNQYGNELNPNLISTAITQLTDKDTASTLQIEGKITEVCQNSGCWMFITDGNNIVRILTKHKFFMPKDCAGSYAVVQGVFKIKEVSPEEQMHYFEESGKTPEKPITETKKEYRIEATGVKLTSIK